MAAYQTPSPARPSAPSRQRGFVWPVLLIVVGGILLLQTLGYVRWDAWADIWRLWPLILILIGVELLVPPRQRYVASALAAVLLVAGAVWVIAFGWTTPWAPAAAVESRSFTQSLQGASQANVQVRFGAGNLNIGALGSRSGDQLASMTYDGPADMPLTTSYRAVGNAGFLTYALDGARWRGWGSVRRNDIDILLAPGVPIELDVNHGAGQARLDLSKLTVTKLQVAGGANDMWIQLPEAAGNTTAQINGGAFSLTVEVPQGVAGQIRTEGGLSSFDIDQARFPPVSDRLYRSADFNSATNRVELTLQAGAASVKVR